MDAYRLPSGYAVAAGFALCGWGKDVLNAPPEASVVLDYQSGRPGGERLTLYVSSKVARTGLVSPLLKLVQLFTLSRAKGVTV